MSMKVAKSIGLLYKLNRFLPETILKTYYTHILMKKSSLVYLLIIKFIAIIQGPTTK